MIVLEMVLGGIFKVFILRCQNLSANRYEKINIKNRTQVLQVWGQWCFRNSGM